MRLVLDTNVWLDWLVFDDPGIAPLKQRFADGRVEIVIDDACEAEFERVLGYPLRKQPVDAHVCLAEFRRIGMRVEPRATEHQVALPRCSDPDDQKFLELAAAARADFLLTKDKALLDVERRLKKSRALTAIFRIVNPRDFFVTQCNSSA
jgi:putative PIN family toxin of toxin-antitoxin system